MIVGQRVVCIDDTMKEPWLQECYTSWIKKGATYVIRGVFLGVSSRNQEGEIGLYLKGLHNPKSNVAPFAERGFNSERFTPIDEIVTEQADDVDVSEPARRELVEV